MDNKTKILKRHLRSKFEVMGKEEFKLFYSIFVHYWVNYKFFINKWNFFNLWCELNKLCHEMDESFPDQYDDHNLVKDFCIEHPFYFVDKLSLKLVKSLFWRYMDKDLEVIIIAMKKLHQEGLRAAYEYINEAMGLAEDIDELVQQTEDNIKAFS